MSSQDDILQQAGESFEYANQYVQKQIDLLKLESAERVAKATSSLITLAVLFFLAALVFIMLSISLGFWLGTVVGSYATGFLIVTGIYALLGLIVFFFKRVFVTNPILSKVLESFFD